MEANPDYSTNFTTACANGKKFTLRTKNQMKRKILISRGDINLSDK